MFLLQLFEKIGKYLWCFACHLNCFGVENCGTGKRIFLSNTFFVLGWFLPLPKFLVVIDIYVFYLHCLSFELFWLFSNWPTFWVFLFWLPPMLLNRIHLHLHVQFYVKQQYDKMLCEVTNLDLLYKWKNKSHTKDPNIYTSLKADLW